MGNEPTHAAIGQFNGADVYRYDGSNADTIVRALGLEPGDGVISFPRGKSIVTKCEILDAVFADTLKLNEPGVTK